MARRQRVAPTPPVVLAPVGGIDDTSALASMDPKYALDMLNMYPESRALRVRFGYREHITSMANNGLTLMAYHNPNGTSELFCATDSGIYDVTTPSSTPTNVKALTNGRCSWTMITNSAGSYLVGCNGTDAAFFYDGTTWANFVATGTPALPGDVNGLAPADFAFVGVHKNRLWVAKKNTSEAYYFPVDSIGGTVNPLYLGPLWKKGGRLINFFSYTFDNGESPDDVLVFQSSEGQLSAYSGSDPSAAATWGLAASYSIGRPLGDRTFAELNGDIMLLNIFGVVSFSQVASGGYQLGASEGTASGRISHTLNEVARERSSSPGWEVHNAPTFQYLIVQLPSSGEAAPSQYIMNTVTGAWCRFDLMASTFIEFDGHLYFTDESGRVLRYEYGLTVDEVPLAGGAGNPIIAGFQQAFNYFGQPSVKKHYKLIRLVFNAQDQPGYRYTLLRDFESGDITSAEVPSTAVSAGGSLWGSGLWDTATWGASYQTFQRWNGLSGDGYCASLVVRTATTLDTTYSASNWVYEPSFGL